MHPNARLIEVFYQAQAAFYAGGDDTRILRGLLADDIAWHVLAVAVRPVPVRRALVLTRPTRRRRRRGGRA